MMKMDGRDSSECQNWLKKKINQLNGINELKDKLLQWSSQMKSKRKKCEIEEEGPVARKRENGDF